MFLLIVLRDMESLGATNCCVFARLEQALNKYKKLVKYQVVTNYKNQT